MESYRNTNNVVLRWRGHEVGWAKSVTRTSNENWFSERVIKFVDYRRQPTKFLCLTAGLRKKRRLNIFEEIWISVDLHESSGISWKLIANKLKWPNIIWFLKPKCRRKCRSFRCNGKEVVSVHSQKFLTRRYTSRISMSVNLTC